MAPQISDTNSMGLPKDKSRGKALAWSSEDLRRALLRRASFPHAGLRLRRSGEGIAHMGVSRRAIRRLGERAAAALVRSGKQETAAQVVHDLAAGSYHDEQMLAIEILDRLADMWPAWAADNAAVLSRSLRHPWVADRLARVQGRLLTRLPMLLSKHAQWAISQNPLRRRAAALALLPPPRRRGSRKVPVARATPILRLLLQDPETHRWVQQAVGQVVIHFAARAPRTIARLLRRNPNNLSPRHLEQARRLVSSLPTAS